ncbi:menaquinone-specific isochorismate synthase [Cytobacillus eiseniae]|uniref:Isochorismate synthase MenF n=1 Tax=Cytobacillus eiseniae TaxID=762947 RepID=A0ABS4RJE0_9BACI|nr:isochorismate synthase [Cytobacillus eiseniae]MBP2243025.1 menaquinone-specific isochorismate synthase [Cytobacillus eiseniae]
MVTIQGTELKEGILKAIERAKNLSKPILVSEVQEIHRIDPLSFFAAGNKLYLGERFFWKDPSNETFMIGLGICKQIQSDQAADRFFLVEKEWKSFIEDAIIYNRYQKNGIGPVMFGGFSFDPLKAKTKLWSKYSNSLFHIPKFMYSELNGKAYLTTNVVCTQHDHASLAEMISAERKVFITAGAELNEEKNELINEEEIHPEKWKETVTAVVNELKAGSLKKVVLARETRLRFNQTIQIEQVLKHLLKEQQESFIFAFESNGDCFIGASPERLVKKNGTSFLTTCLAGSSARGKTEEEDQRLGNELLNDPKNSIEHHYVVRMIKEAMEAVCEEVTLPNKTGLLKMRDIQHLYTPVTGKAKKDTSLLSLVDRLHPTPALGGLPKMEAVQKIREVEELDRGFYGAPIGWMDYEENGEFAVSIRSGLIQGDEASIFAGCGVVEDSIADSEYIETKIKFRPMLTALGGIIK